MEDKKQAVLKELSPLNQRVYEALLHVGAKSGVPQTIRLSALTKIVGINNSDAIEQALRNLVKAGISIQVSGPNGQEHFEGPLLSEVGISEDGTVTVVLGSVAKLFEKG